MWVFEGGYGYFWTVKSLKYQKHQQRMSDLTNFLEKYDTITLTHHTGMAYLQMN